MRYLCVLFLMFALLPGCSKEKQHYVTRHRTDRDTSDTYPELTGNAFRHFCNHIVDNTRVPFYPEKVKEGDIVFLKTKYIDKFVKYMHPKIKHPYVLMTHSGDEDIPGEHARLLDDKKIMLWVGMNTTLSHPKLMPIPIGIEGRPVLEIIADLKAHPVKKERLLYLNFGATHPERALVKHFFSDKAFCTIQDTVPRKEYLTEVMRSKFIVSPRGNGIDCCRVWESLLLGTIPVLKTSSLDALYQDLPVLIVQDWSEVTEEFLERKYEEMAGQQFNLDKLHMDYWFELINRYRA